MTTTQFIEQAQRGYDFLATVGRQWDFDVVRLNPDTLDMSSGMDCALCQAGNTHYWKAMERLADEGYPVTDAEMVHELEGDGDACCTYLWEQAHGFRLVPGVGYARLTEAWREVIKKARDR